MVSSINVITIDHRGIYVNIISNTNKDDPETVLLSV